MDPLLGGTLETVPDRYALFSPTTHVRSTSPPTLLIQGKDDVLAPVTATDLLFEKLVAADISAVNIVFPHALQQSPHTSFGDPVCSIRPGAWNEEVCSRQFVEG